MEWGRLAARAFATAGAALLIGAVSCFYAFQDFLSGPTPPGAEFAFVLTALCAAVAGGGLIVGIVAGVAALLHRQ